MEMEDYPEPWITHPEIWKTKAAFFTWMRGCLRRGLWEKYPPKIQFKNAECNQPPGWYTGRAKTGTNCALTGEWTGKSRLQVDHIKGRASLKDWDDVSAFIAHLCHTHNNLQLVTKEAHNVKSYADTHGLTFEEALIEKQVIKFTKHTAVQQKEILTTLEVDSEDLTSAAKRKAAMRVILQGGK